MSSSSVVAKKDTALYTEETIASKIFIVKGRDVNSYESDYYRRRAKDIHARNWYMRILTLYANNAYVTLNGKKTGAKFRTYGYWVVYDSKKKKWFWRYAGGYVITLGPGQQHTVRTKWRGYYYRRYTYIYRYEPGTYRKVDAPPTAKGVTPFEALSLLSPATLLNTLDQMNILEETFAFHSTLSNLAAPVTSLSKAEVAAFDVQAAIALSDLEGKTLADEDGEEVEVFTKATEDEDEDEVEVF